MIPMAMSLGLDISSFVPNRIAKMLPWRSVINPTKAWTNEAIYVGKCREHNSVSKNCDQQLNGQHHFWKGGSTAPRRNA